MSLDHFIRLADGIVDFEVLLTRKKIPLSSTYIINIHKEELKSKWENTKAAYDTFMQERAEEQEEDNDKPRTTRSHKSSKSIFEEETTEEETFKAKLNSTYLSYCNCYAELAEIHDSFKSTSVSFVQKNRNFSSGFQLPACDTPTFHGDYYSWPSFRDSFTATFIQSNLSPVQKLLNLRQRTKGEAFNIASRVPLEDADFDIDWVIYSFVSRTKELSLRLKFANFLNFLQSLMNVPNPLRCCIEK